MEHLQAVMADLLLKLLLTVMAMVIVNHHIAAVEMVSEVKLAMVMEDKAMDLVVQQLNHSHHQGQVNHTVHQVMLIPVVVMEMEVVIQVVVTEVSVAE